MRIFVAEVVIFIASVGIGYLTKRLIQRRVSDQDLIVCSLVAAALLPLLVWSMGYE